MIGNLFSLASKVVTIPVATVADTVTLGGTLVDRKEPFIVTEVKDAVEDFKDIFDPVRW